MNMPKLSVAPAVYVLILAGPLASAIPYYSAHIYVLMITFIACIILLTQNIKIPAKDIRIWLLIVAAVFIDKIQDFASSFSINSVGPFVFAAVISLFMITCRRDSFPLIWKWIIMTCFVQMVGMLMYVYMVHGTIVNIHTTAGLMIFIICAVLYYKRWYYRILIFPAAYFVLEIIASRSIALGMAIFLVSTFLIRENTALKVKKHILFCILLDYY